MNTFWSESLEKIRERVNDQSFRAWFEPIKPVSLTDSELILSVPDNYFEQWIKDNYLDLIKEISFGSFRKNMKISFVCEEPLKDPGERQEGDPKEGGPEFNETENLIAHYTFENFVSGNSNQFACSASQYVAENPAKGYNPLFIYGGVGLGKTHLLHAIGHGTRRKFRKLKLLYLSSETYVNEVLGAIRMKKMDALRYKYRANCDVFLVDDIQYLSGKEFVQEEFFHTFNFLHGAGKQIVISSDQSPQSIPKISDRLKSRFQWGLITDIAPPEYETRVEIVKKKACAIGVELPDAVVNFIADRILGNVREIEGALNRITAYAKIKMVPISFDLAREVLKKLTNDRTGRVTIDNIIKRVSDYFNIKASDLRCDKRHRSVSVPRQIAMYLARKHTHTSLPVIGENFGGRDHTTVLVAVRKIDEQIKDDPVIERAVKDLERELGV